MIFVILDPDCRKKGEPVDRMECKRANGGLLYGERERLCVPMDRILVFFRDREKAVLCPVWQKEERACFFRMRFCYKAETFCVLHSGFFLHSISFS